MIRKLARRVYQCADCGQKIVITTNHQSDCWPQCRGKCRNVITHPDREIVLRKQTTHNYVEEWDRCNNADSILVD